MSLIPGTRVGPYEVVSAIGAGGMGEVYRARDTKLGRDVALKILPELFAADPERLVRFEREAKTLATLNHPHIAQIHGVEESSGVRALVMELVDGEDLGQRIAGGPLPLDEALAIAKQIAEALEAAHEAGIIHRDLKPANMKLRPDGTVKVLDFGLAKAAATDIDVANSPTYTMAATELGVIVGTAAYMAPEQARGKAVDKRADIWAFGCVLYEMLTGRAAFDGQTVTDILAAVLERAPDLTRLPHGTPRRIEELLRRCLQKDPKRRLRDIGDARFELEREGELATSELGTGRRRWREVAGWIAAVAVTTAVIPIVLDRLRTADPEIVRVAISVPNPSPEPDLALSPDGRALAYVALGEAGQSQLWVRRLDERDARPLPGTARARVPFWSPDSRHIGFSADNQLKRVSAAGGPVQTLCQLSPARGSAHITGAAWSDHGVIFFGGDTTDGTTVFRVPDTGGTAVPALKADPLQKARGAGWPHLLPDGRHFLYSTFGTGTRVATIEGDPLGTVLPVGGEMVIYANGHLIAVRDRMLVAYPFDLETLKVRGDPLTIDERAVISRRNYAAVSASANERLAFRSGRSVPRQLRWYSRQGAPLGDVGRLGGYQQVNLAPDGRRVLVDELGVEGKRVDLLLIDLVSGVASPLVTGAGLFATSSVWTRDGRVLYTTSMTPSTLRLKSPSDGSDKVLATEMGVIATDTTPDGAIVVRSRDKIELLSPVSGKREELIQARSDEGHAHLSPDGRWVTWQSFESGQAQVYVATFPGFGARRQVSLSGGCQPRWSRDGRELFYPTLDGKLMSVDVHARGAAPEVMPPRLLFELPLVVVPAREQYDVSADGQRFLVAVERERSAVIEVVLNWTGLLRRGAP
jgi:eukaryotic-like serine/threonine-protein kinase